MPSYLSEECKDLIRQMLVVDPLKRITIPEIRYVELDNKEVCRNLTFPLHLGRILGFKQICHHI